MDPNKDILLATDESIQEGDDDMLHAVSYGSFATTPHQAGIAQMT